MQYPTVEKYFRLDLRVLRNLTTLLTPPSKRKDLNKIFEGIELTFPSEFDFAREAAFLRQCAGNINPIFGDKVRIPLPLDGAHPAVAKLRGRRGTTTLCTRKVLAMEEVPGVAIKKKLRLLIATWAAQQGKTVEQLKQDFR